MLRFRPMLSPGDNGFEPVSPHCIEQSQTKAAQEGRDYERM
jgi:hypothetical protein